MLFILLAEKHSLWQDDNCSYKIAAVKCLSLEGQKDTDLCRLYAIFALISNQNITFIMSFYRRDEFWWISYLKMDVLADEDVV